LAKATTMISDWTNGLNIYWKQAGKDMENALSDPTIFKNAYGHWDLFYKGLTRLGFGFYEITDGLIQGISGLFQWLVGAFTSDTKLMEIGWKNFTEGLGNFIKGAADIVISIFEIIAGVFKGIFGEIIIWIKNIINQVIGWMNALINKVNTWDFTNPFTGKKVDINIKNIKPLKMATGGIINMPNKGVPITSGVVGGESGREGVLPLTNEQTMSELGKEIGKHIVLNIDLTTELDGRILNKRLEIIKQENNFSRNGG